MWSDWLGAYLASSSLLEKLLTDTFSEIRSDGTYKCWTLGTWLDRMSAEGGHKDCGSIFTAASNLEAVTAILTEQESRRPFQELHSHSFL